MKKYWFDDVFNAELRGESGLTVGNVEDFGKIEDERNNQETKISNLLCVKTKPSIFRRIYNFIKN